MVKNRQKVDKVETFLFDDIEALWRVGHGGKLEFPRRKRHVKIGNKYFVNSGESKEELDDKNDLIIKNEELTNKYRQVSEAYFICVTTKDFYPKLIKIMAEYSKYKFKNRNAEVDRDLIKKFSNFKLDLLNYIQKFQKYTEITQAIEKTHTHNIKLYKYLETLEITFKSTKIFSSIINIYQ